MIKQTRHCVSYCRKTITMVHDASDQTHSNEIIF